MKMLHFYFSLTALGLCFGTLPSAAAGGAAPDFSLPEQSAICLIQSAFSAASAVLEQKGCSSVPIVGYKVNLETFYDGRGSILVDRLSLGVKLTPDDEGAICQVTGVEAGHIHNTLVKGYQASYRIGKSGSVFSGNARLQVGGETYRQHLATNFGVSPTAVPEWGPEDRVILGEGKEEVSRPAPPPGKWDQTLKYLREDRVWIEKVQTVSSTDTKCRLVFKASVDNFGGGFQFTDAAFFITKR